MKKTDKKTKRGKIRKSSESLSEVSPSAPKRQKIDESNNSEDKIIHDNLQSKKKHKKEKKINMADANIDDDNSIREDIDSGEGKKRNKKKKKPEEQPSDVPESKMSKRQMKREKHAQRMAEAEAASHKAVQTQALSYLSLWKFNKAEWKFNKVKQIWLQKHKFDLDKIPDELWKPYIEYFSAASGSVKQLLISDSQKIVEQMENSLETKDDKSKPSDLVYKRARDLLQNIH